MLKTIIASTVVGIAYLAATFSHPADSNMKELELRQPEAALQNKEQEQETDKIKQEMRQKFMKGKLESNKKIVEGLTTTNYKLIAEGAQEVTQYVKGQHWFVLDTPEYKTFSLDMENKARRIEKAAEDRNLEAAALRYFELTVNCMDCHQYINKMKY